MNIRAPFAVALVFLTAPLSCGRSQHDIKNSDHSETIYISQDNTSAFAVVNNTVYVGGIASDMDLRLIPSLLGPDGQLRQISTPSIACVSVGPISLAVPRTPMTGRRYQCNGIDFVVARCSPDSCSAYEIMAVCRHYENGSCSNRASDSGVDFSYRFRGSSQSGVTEIDLAPSSRNRAGELTLRRGVGLLRTYGDRDDES